MVVPSVLQAPSLPRLEVENAKVEAPPARVEEEKTAPTETPGEPVAVETADVKTPEDKSPRISVFEGLESIREKPSWKAPVVGLIRAGQSVKLSMEKPEEGPGVEPCAGGWYAVVPRGYVCVGQRSTLSRDDPRVLAAAEALAGKREEGTFRFGVSIGAPRYQRIPTPEEQRRVEKGLDEYLSHLPGPDEAEGGAIDTRASGSPPSAALARYFSDSTHPLVASNDAFAGMKVAWTREFDAAGRTWLVTPDLSLIPKDKVRTKPVPTLRGVDLRAGNAWSLPLAYLWLGPLPKMQKGPDGALMETGEEWPRQSFVPLSGGWLKQGGVIYLEARDGSYLRRDRVTRIDRAKGRPKGVGAKDKWVSVRVTHGYLVAYEGDAPVFATAISPGMNGVNPAVEHTTRPGIYSVQVKAWSWDMAGVDRGKPWLVKEVPFVAFYKDNFGLHGAWWHDDFGRPKSHGCINLSPADAQRMFEWMDPALPEGWYWVSAMGPKLPGTVIEVRP